MADEAIWPPVNPVPGQPAPAMPPKSPVNDGGGTAGGEDAGRGKFGDGKAAPLYEFQASRFKGGRMFTPNVIRVWPDRIEEYEHHALRKKGTQAIPFQQVSEVAIAQGLIWSDVSVESTGGRSIVMSGIPKADAEKVKALLDVSVSTVKSGGGLPVPAAAPPAAPAQDLAGQLRQLAGLRDEGILSEEEFAAQKAKLLA